MTDRRPRPSSEPPAPAPLDGAPLEDDPLDQVISLAEAAELAGLAPHTLTQQAKRNRLHARKIGHTWLTTRYWLDEYLRAHSHRVTPTR
ncbi:MAG: hypothetical protein M0R75_13725 [Dehalococcoidia bacterium]|nr:hypothetical protein [Dehalococcoidia bacterium]